MTISIVAAIGKNRELGKNNKLLWHIPEDMKRFRQLTTGHVVIMGRKTYESIGRPLPNRINIVITRDKKKLQSIKRLNDLIICSSLEEAVEKAKHEIRSSRLPDEIFIIGGGQIYQQALPVTDKLYLTIVEGNFDADTFFPDYSEFKKTISRKDGKIETLSYSFLELSK